MGISSFLFAIVTLSVFLNVQTRPLRAPILVGISDFGLNSLGRNVGRCGEIVRAFYNRRVRSFSADRYADDHSDTDEDQCCRTFKIQSCIMQKFKIIN